MKYIQFAYIFSNLETPFMFYQSSHSVIALFLELRTYLKDNYVILGFSTNCK